MRLFFFLIIYITFVRPAQACDDNAFSLKKDYLLVINTYTADAPWSNAIIEPVEKWISSEHDFAFFTEHLNMLFINDPVEFNRVADAFLSKYAEKAPKGVLLLGNSALLMKDKIKDRWGDLPLILCAEVDFFGPDTYYFNKHAIPEQERVPLSVLTDDYNMTVLQTKMFPRENVKLLKRMIPGLKEVLLVGDGRYVNQQLDYDIRRMMKEEYPELKYRFLSAADITLEELMSLLGKIDINSTGVLFSSWFQKSDIAGVPILNANSFRVIANLAVPVFALKSAVMNNSGMVGGVFFDNESFECHLKQTVLSVLAGSSPRKMPFMIPSEAIPTFNYPSLLLKGFSVEQCPSNSLFLNRPQTFFQQYKGLILGVLIVVLLIFWFLYQRIRTLRILNEVQQQQMETNRELANLFANMPVGYMKAKLLWDASGEIIDMEICRMNGHFTEIFIGERESGQTRANAIFSTDANLMLRLADMSVSEKRAITYTQYFSQQNSFQNVVVTPATQEGYVDTYYLDVTELHNAQKKLDDINHKLSLALDVANIIPWNWNLRDHKILCDVNRPVELRDIDQHIDEEKLSVPDAQYFSKIHKEDRERVEKAYNSLIEGHIDKVCEEYRVITHDKNGYKLDWVEAKATVDTRDAEGKPLTLVGSSLVITQRKKWNRS